jgi:hypothetical protein
VTWTLYFQLMGLILVSGFMIAFIIQVAKGGKP